MLELKSVSAGYGSFQALFDVSLKVGAGEAVAVIGPNGAGKTTLLRVISKLIEVSSGEVSMEGVSLNSVPAHRVIDLGIVHVPENRRLFPRLTVEENLRIGAYPQAARAHFAERLEFIYSLFPRMQERRGQLAGTLSGGEQQMCAIGRGLMSGPKLLLLDEPSAGLAPVISSLGAALGIVILSPDLMLLAFLICGLAARMAAVVTPKRLAILVKVSPDTTV